MSFDLMTVAVVPELIPQDPGFEKITFQFPPQQMTENIGVTWATSNAPTRGVPIVQFAHGELDTISFTAKLWATHALDNIKDKLEAMKRSVRQDPTLLRPPIWLFVWGEAIDDLVVIDSIGGIRYDSLRSDGSVRGCTFAITLSRYTFFDVAATDPNAPPPSTFFVPARSGDIWEAVARTEYGNPDLGDLLRRRNPGLAEPGNNPGQVLALLPRSRYRDEPIEPASIPLQRTTAALTRRLEAWDERTVARESTVLIQGPTPNATATS